MSLTVTTIVSAKHRSYDADVHKVADAISDRIKSEATELAKAGYTVIPTSIRVTPEAGYLEITMRAER